MTKSSAQTTWIGIPPTELEKHLVGERLVEAEQRDRPALGGDHGSGRAAGSSCRASRPAEDRPGIDDDHADAEAEPHADGDGADHAEERVEARLHDEGEDPGREAHRRREGQVDLSPTVTMKTSGTTRNSATGSVSSTEL